MRARRERRIADRRRAERIELRGEMAVAADRLREVRGADDCVDVDADVGASRTRLPAGSSSAGVHDSKASARRGIDRLGILPVALVQLENVPGIDSRELHPDA